MENTNVKNEEGKKNNTMWVTIPNRYIREFTKEFMSDKEGKELPNPISKTYYVVNVPTTGGKNMSFFVPAKVQHPQIKDYSIIPIGEGEKTVTFSHLEKDESGKNVFVREEPSTKLTQAHIANMLKERFYFMNKENKKYLILPKELIHEGERAEDHKKYKYVTLPDYMKEYNGHMLAGATMLLPYQISFEYTKKENLAVIEIEDDAHITLWPQGRYDNKTEFVLTGKELLNLNRNDYKEYKNTETSKTDLEKSDWGKTNFGEKEREDFISILEKHNVYDKEGIAKIKNLRLENFNTWARMLWDFPPASFSEECKKEIEQKYNVSDGVLKAIESEKNNSAENAIKDFDEKFSDKNFEIGSSNVAKETVDKEKELVKDDNGRD